MITTRRAGILLAAALLAGGRADGAPGAATAPGALQAGPFAVLARPGARWEYTLVTGTKPGALKPQKGAPRIALQVTQVKGGPITFVRLEASSTESGVPLQRVIEGAGGFKDEVEEILRPMHLAIDQDGLHQLGAETEWPPGEGDLAQAGDEPGPLTFPARLRAGDAGSAKAGDELFLSSRLRRETVTLNGRPLVVWTQDWEYESRDGETHKTTGTSRTQAAFAPELGPTLLCTAPILSRKIACLRIAPGAATPAQPPAPGAQGDDTALIGVLTRQLTPGCERGKDVWREPSHHEIGFVRVLLPAGVDARALLGRVVLARGRTADENVPPRRAFDNGGLCSVQQMRSDWVVSKDGVRLYTERDGALARMGVFAAAAVQAVEPPVIVRPPAPPSSAPAPADRLTVRFRNPLARPLQDLRIEGHYEGCSGKPGATADTVAAGAVAAGALAEVTLPRLQGDKTGTERAYRLASLRLSTSTPGVVFDLDYPVPREASECPRR